MLTKFVKRSRANTRARVCLEGDEVSYSPRGYGSISYMRDGEYGGEWVSERARRPYSPSMRFLVVDEMIV